VKLGAEEGDTSPSGSTARVCNWQGRRCRGQARLMPDWLDRSVRIFTNTIGRTANNCISSKRFARNADRFWREQLWTVCDQGAVFYLESLAKTRAPKEEAKLGDRSGRLFGDVV